jgi:uncharacterized protein YjiS (DUF1127 family)
MQASAFGYRSSARLENPDAENRTAGARNAVLYIAALLGRWGRRIRRINGPYLNEFSDAQLRDIGLSRFDVERPGR